MKVDRGTVLIGLARHAIAERLGISAVAPEIESAAWLQATAATFVTLTMRGALRGCIGTLTACRPLHEDVTANAVAAAFHDPRFPPLTAAEFDVVRVEVSLLSAMQPLAFADESGALSAIRPGVDGVVLEYGSHKATFLPQVWAQLPEPEQFMAHLKLKAGLTADFWHPDLRLFIYQVEKFQEKEAL